MQLHFSLLQVAGVEPARDCSRGILSPLRLPIPPHLRTLCLSHCRVKWAEVDSNHRSNLQQIYSLSPLATRESAHLSVLTDCIFIPHYTSKRKYFLYLRSLFYLTLIYFYFCMKKVRQPSVHDPMLTPVLDEVFSSLVPLRVILWRPSQ